MSQQMYLKNPNKSAENVRVCALWIRMGCCDDDIHLSSVSKCGLVCQNWGVKICSSRRTYGHKHAHPKAKIQFVSGVMFMCECVCAWYNTDLRQMLGHHIKSVLSFNIDFVVVVDIFCFKGVVENTQSQPRLKQGHTYL